MDNIESTKYAVYDYGRVTSDGGFVVAETTWATQAPMVSPAFRTREEAWEWWDSQKEESEK